MDFLLVEMVPMAYRLASELSSQHADEEEHKEAAYLRLESLGFRVGQGLVERYATWLKPSPYTLADYSVREK